ncbi:MAG: amino acid ABC transporter permease [Aggregatilineales bacterium]
MAIPDAEPRTEKVLDSSRLAAGSRIRLRFLFLLPWWLFALVGLWVLVVILIALDEQYSQIYAQLREGIGLTLYLAFAAYAIALGVGLFVGLVRANRPTPPPHGVGIVKILRHTIHALLYNVLTFYVEFMRGIPTLVFLLIAGFIIVPALRDTINTQFIPLVRTLLNNPEIPDLIWRGRDAGTAIAGLALVYGAFLSEIFRGGIQSIEKGQLEAARSLGMTFLQTMRFVVIPQAVRRVLPPLGNDFVAMIKDTSLVTILGVDEITQLARRWSGSTFFYLQTYLVLSLIYLTMTVLGSLLVQMLERYLRRSER